MTRTAVKGSSNVKKQAPTKLYKKTSMFIGLQKLTYKSSLSLFMRRPMKDRIIAMAATDIVYPA